MAGNWIARCLVALAFGWLLSGCSQAPSQVRAFTYVLQDAACTAGKGCKFKKTGSILLNVSSQSQQVTYLHLVTDGARNTAKFGTFEDCTVVSEADFSCKELGRINGAFIVHAETTLPVDYVSDSLFAAYIAPAPTQSNFDFIESLPSATTWVWSLVGAFLALALFGAVFGS